MLSFFFFNDTATTEIYTLSLHDALPISVWSSDGGSSALQTRTDPAGLLPRYRHRSTPWRGGILGCTAGDKHERWYIGRAPGLRSSLEGTRGADAFRQRGGCQLCTRCR